MVMGTATVHRLTTNFPAWALGEIMLSVPGMSLSSGPYMRLPVSLNARRRLLESPEARALPPMVLLRHSPIPLPRPRRTFPLRVSS